MDSFSSSLAYLAYLAMLFSVASAQLNPRFYVHSCPRALEIIRKTVFNATRYEPRMGASLLRLHFHDCFVGGCDASVLLDDTANFTGEKTAFPNVNSLRGFDVIDSIKSQLEAVCPNVVSCADIVAVAARDSVVALYGPTWPVALGRRDSTTANITAANSDLPSPFSNLTTLISAFSKKGLTAQEMVTLSGGHTIGKARCSLFRSRIYNETNIDSTYAKTLQESCPFEGGDANLSDLDETGQVFDNTYYKDLVASKGLLHSDQVLYNRDGGSTDFQVVSYNSNNRGFFDDFANAMIKMGNISPLTGSAGQIRSNCRQINVA